MSCQARAPSKGLGLVGLGELAINHLARHVFEKMPASLLCSFGMFLLGSIGVQMCQFSVRWHRGTLICLYLKVLPEVLLVVF